MTESDNIKRLNAIVAGASQLSIETQKYILATIKGMLLSHNLTASQDNQSPKPPNPDK